MNINTISTTSSVSHNTPVNNTDIISQIDGETKDTHVVVLLGTSDNGYNDQEDLEKLVYDIYRSVTDTVAKEYPPRKVKIFIGSTEIGIGAGYRIAKLLQPPLETLGIVSSKADKNQYSANCDKHFVVISDRWDVEYKNGESAMVYAATSKPEINRTGEIFVLNAGNIGRSEMEEAIAKGIKTTIYPNIQDKYGNSPLSEYYKTEEGKDYIVCNEPTE